MKLRFSYKFFILIFLAFVFAAILFIFQKPPQVGEAPETIFNPATPDVVLADQVLLNVPFTSQAPLADWIDPRHQEGCEEASLLMAWLWINGQNMTKDEAEKTIEDMAAFELYTYGNFRDTNSYDTARVMKDYYQYEKTEVKINPTIEDIKNALRQGKLVLVPVNGQKLNNPNFKRPGPTTHMLVIKGFDNSKNQFITNDPGTRLGESYIYDYPVVYDAMVDYPTGDHLSQDDRPKSMIVI